MSSQPICPSCHSPQAVQRVATIVSGGTQQVRIITADLMPATGVAALVSIVITAGIAQLRERSRRAATEQWSQQIGRWQQSWYCHRCHTAFVAGSSKAVSPEQFGQILTV